MIDRRRFLAASALTLAFGGLRRATEATAATIRGELAAPTGPLSLPPGFEQVVLSRHGEEMDDGLLVPDLHDGMGAFAGPRGRVILVRNHEVIREQGLRRSAFGARLERLDRIDRSLLYDAGRRGVPELGGTTTLVFDPASRRIERHFLSLGGTSYNCAGGETPWGTWVTCEEWTQTVDDDCAADHGWCFEVPADPNGGLVAPRRLPGLGRFKHEAVAVTPDGRVVYCTEDRPDGCLYRFLPERPGELAGPGRLQALHAIDRRSLDSRNWPKESGILVRPRDRFAVRWMDVDETHAPKDDLRDRAFSAGAIRFARCEGAWYGAARGEGESPAVYVAATTGGPKELGQIWTYRPSPHEGTAREAEAPPTLELFVESTDASLLKNCDNVVVAPWGDLFVCEDGEGACGLVRVSPDGAMSRFALNVVDDGELAGACFSPDGRWLFVNLQKFAATVAITGPWERYRAG